MPKVLVQEVLEVLVPGVLGEGVADVAGGAGIAGTSEAGGAGAAGT